MINFVKQNQQEASYCRRYQFIHFNLFAVQFETRHVDVASAWHYCLFGFDQRKFWHALFYNIVCLLKQKISRLNGIILCIFAGSLFLLKQACLIAFASEFVNKIVYQLYYSPDCSMTGYTNFTLSYMDIREFDISEEDQKILNGTQFCRSVSQGAFFFIYKNHIIMF